MKPSPISFALLGPFLLLATGLLGQSTNSPNQSAASPAAAASTPEVPRLIKFSGNLLDERGHAVPGPVGVTFALYAQQAGGAALWLETQNVKPDTNGDYIVLLGANSAKGVPAELFISGEARWLGVQVEHEQEHERILFVSVPYALKAADAETLGGKPASAYALSGAPGSIGNNAIVPQTIVAPTTAAAAPGTDSASAASSAIAAASACTAITADGTATANQLAKFSGPCQIHQSLLSDNGTAVSAVGAFNLPAVAAATSTVGKNSFSSNFTASSFSSSTHLPVNQNFRWQAEPVGNNTSSPSGKLNLLFASGTGTPAETGLSINNKGQITFATGQTFPTVTGNETVTGTVSGSQLISTVANGTAPLKVTSTTVVPNLNANFLDGLSLSNFALVGSPNVFTQNQSIFGRLGIGTTTPAYAVHAYGSDSGLGIRIKAQNTSTTGNSLAGFFANGTEANASNVVAAVFYADGLGTSPLGTPGGYYGTFTNHPIGLFTNNTERIRIAATGEVGIGTKTPSAQLEVRAVTGATGIMATGGDGTNVVSPSYGLYVTGGSAGSGPHGVAGMIVYPGLEPNGSRIAYAGIFEGYISVDSCITFVSAPPIGNCSSDVRLKKNIRPYPSVLEKLTHLQPVSYNWRVDEYPQFRFASTRTSGLIAQEVEKVFPDMVSTDEAGYKRVNYGELPYLMLQAIRELKAESDTLKAENDSLRERIQRLEAAETRTP